MPAELRHQRATTEAGRTRDGSIDNCCARRPRRFINALMTRMRRRAADRASDDRILAEAVAALGGAIALARGESREAGATDALDRLLKAPGLDQSRRIEAEAMLRLSLRLAAEESEGAAARLRSLPGDVRVPVDRDRCGRPAS